MMNDKMNDLLNRKMDRKEFLKHIGYGTVVLFGLGSAMKLLATASTNTPKLSATNSQQQLANSGYGKGAYGG